MLLRTSSQNGSNVHGTLLVVTAAMIFALVALVIKKNPLPSTLAAEVRFLVGWLMSLTFMLRFRRERGLSFLGPAQSRCGIITRGCLTCSFVTLWWAALRRAPLGDCIALVYCSPLLTVTWSRVILGEKVLPIFPLQALLATVGVCFIVQPPLLISALGVDPAHNLDNSGNYTLAICAMCVCSFMPIVTRQTKEASWIEVEHVTNMLNFFILNPLVIFAGYLASGETTFALPALPASDVGPIVLAALGSSAGVAIQTRGYQMAEPGKATMYTNLEIPFAYLLQHMCTDIPLSMTSIIGAILVLMNCLVGAVAEMRSSRRDETIESPLLKEEDSRADAVQGG